MMNWTDYFWPRWLQQSVRGPSIPSVTSGLLVELENTKFRLNQQGTSLAS